MEVSAARAPRSRRSPLVLSGTIGACIGLLIAAVLGVRELAQDQADARVQPLVEVLSVAPGPIRAELIYAGLVQAPQQATITAITAGTLTSLNANVGTLVRAGDRIASLTTESLPAQLRQAQADLVAAESRRALVQAGTRSGDVDSARAVLAAAEARLAQLIAPSAADLAAERSTLANAQAALATAEATIETNRALLLGAVANACATPLGTGIPVPCSGTPVPLTAEVTDAVAGFLQSRVDPRSDLGARAVAVLTTNGNYRGSLASAEAARQAVTSARAKLDALQSPSAADLASQRAQVEIARGALDNKVNPYTDADVQSANAAIARAAAQIAITEASLARTSIVAPFDGVIAQRFVETGANVTPTTPLFLVVAKGALVHMTLRDTDAISIKTGLSVEVTASDIRTPLVGRVVNVAPVGDIRAHTVEVQVSVGDASATLRSGTLAQVRMITAEKTGVIAVPSSALLLQDQATRVYTVSDGKARIRDVTVGIVNRTTSEITGGLKPGDVVIVRGHNTLHEGQPVKVVPPAR